MGYSALTNLMNRGSFRTAIDSMLSELFGLQIATQVSITGATSLSASALGKVHFCTGTSADYTIDLPTAVGNSGSSIIFKGSPALTKNVTIQGVSGQLIGGEAVRSFNAGGMFNLLSDGSNWIIVGEIGSWVTNYTAVLTGFSVDPTVTVCSYFRVGRCFDYRFSTSLNGTSNATTLTVTMPFNAGPSVQSFAAVSGTNNGTPINGPQRVDTRANSNVLDCYINPIAGAWTSSGNKRIAFSIAGVQM